MAVEELHTVAEAADALRVNRETLYRAIRRGEIEVVRVGRVLRVPEASLERLRRHVEKPSASRDGRTPPPHRSGLSQCRRRSDHHQHEAREAGTMADRRLKPASPPAFFLSRQHTLTPAVIFPSPRKDPELRGPNHLDLRGSTAAFLLEGERRRGRRGRWSAGGSVGGRLVSSASGASPGGHLSR